MSGKYSGLPDIDSSSTDIYETPDIISQSINAGAIGPTTVTGTANENIDQANLSIPQAKDKFSTKEVYLSDDVDFSSQIGSINKDSYRTRSVKETLDMKITRLKKEVAEVQAELETENSAQAANIKKDIVGLEEILNKLAITKDDTPSQLHIYSTLGEDTTTHATTTDTATTPAPTSTSIVATATPTNAIITKYIQRIAQLEARLTTLEDRIGTTTITIPKPILVTVDDIRRKVSLFTNDPNSIQKASNNLKEIISSVDKLKSHQQSITASRSTAHAIYSSDSTSTNTLLTPTTTSEAKINFLYDQLSTLDNYGPIIPRILSRLESLQGLHSDASSSISRLKDIENTISLMHNEISQWKQSLSTLETKLIDHDSKSTKNREELQKWLSTLNS